MSQSQSTCMNAYQTNSTKETFENQRDTIKTFHQKYLWPNISFKIQAFHQMIGFEGQHKWCVSKNFSLLVPKSIKLVK